MSYPYVKYLYGKFYSPTIIPYANIIYLRLYGGGYHGRPTGKPTRY
jgi:hypothetical protein